MNRLLTVILPPAKGPIAFPVEAGISSAAGSVTLKTWTGQNHPVNCYIFEGNVSLKECEQRINLAEGVIDPLLVVPSNGVVELDVEITSQQLTFYFERENSTTQSQAVTVEIC